MSKPTEETRNEKLYSGTDWTFAAFIVLEFIAFAVFPGLPLAVAGAAMATRLRQSKKRKLTLWILAGVLTVIGAAPFILEWLGLSEFSTVETTYG